MAAGSLRKEQGAGSPDPPRSQRKQSFLAEVKGQPCSVSTQRWRVGGPTTICVGGAGGPQFTLGANLCRLSRSRGRGEEERREGGEELEESGVGRREEENG